MNEALDQDVRRAFWPIVVARFTSNLAARFVYPFLPASARGLGVSLEAAGASLAVRDMAGLAGPAAGRLADRPRPKRTMVITLLVLAVATTLGGVGSSLLFFTVAMTAVALTQMTFAIVSMSWLAHRVPYGRRGRVFGLVEVSWAGAFLLGVPLVGLAIETWGWRSPFPLVGISVALSAVIVAIAVPRDAPAVEQPDEDSTGTEFEQSSARHPDRAMVFFAVGAMSMAVQLVVVSYGAWLEDDFGFTIAAIGLATVLIGVSELVGSAGSAFSSDHFGKRATILFGMAVMTPAAALLGTVGSATTLGLVLLALVIFGFELAFVSSLPLVAELDPHARGVSMGVGAAVATVGRAAGSLVGIVIYARAGIGLTGLVAAAIAAIGGLVLYRRVSEPE
jgi:predicted MFS family arabinose efflux permease